MSREAIQLQFRLFYISVGQCGRSVIGSVSKEKKVLGPNAGSDLLSEEFPYNRLAINRFKKGGQTDAAQAWSVAIATSKKRLELIIMQFESISSIGSP